MDENKKKNGCYKKLARKKLNVSKNCLELCI